MSTNEVEIGGASPGARPSRRKSSLLERLGISTRAVSKPTLRAGASVKEGGEADSTRSEGGVPTGEASWSKARSLKMVITSVDGKIPLENKVDFLPEGETKDVANALHRGIGPALRAVASSTSSTSSVPGNSADVEAVAGASFVRVRKAFGIGEHNFFSSVALQQGRTESDMKCIPTKEASGKSKAFFFFSPDQRYVFKTCTAKDLKTLVRILPRYVTHVEAAVHTLLPRYVALFRVAGGPTFVCMTNVFGGQYKVHQRYDLKGSTYGRVASAKELAKKSPVLKDGDWVNTGVQLAFRKTDGALSEEDVQLQVPLGEASGVSTASGPSGCSTGAVSRRSSTIAGVKAFLAAVETDVFFLASVRLIDYSLLVGVHKRLADTKYGKKAERTPGLVVLDDGEVIQYVCIVDILTPYGPRKRAETFFMGTLRCGANISCQPPRRYARRFLAFTVAAAGDDSRGGPRSRSLSNEDGTQAV